MAETAAKQVVSFNMYLASSGTGDDPTDGFLAGDIGFGKMTDITLPTPTLRTTTNENSSLPDRKVTGVESLSDFTFSLLDFTRSASSLINGKEVFFEFAYDFGELGEADTDYRYVQVAGYVTSNTQAFTAPIGATPMRQAVTVLATRLWELQSGIKDSGFTDDDAGRLRTELRIDTKAKKWWADKQDSKSASATKLGVGA